MHHYQNTLKSKINCSGIGIHSGKTVNLSIEPAPINYGIRFIRTDLCKKIEIKAHFNNVISTNFATSISHKNIIISTIEHIMAALFGMLIDNAIIKINSNEIPIMDGSAKPFIKLINKVGIKKQEALKTILIIKKPISLIEGEKSITVYPYPKYKISYGIKYNHPLIKKQAFIYDSEIHSFINNISYARTFGFLKEIKSMKKNGLIKGGSIKNSIVLSDEDIINKKGLRCSKEFVKHKILDCIGDFSLIGFNIFGHIVAIKSGHKLNHAFLKKMIKKKKSWTLNII